MKSNNKFTKFTLRGLDKVAIEFGLMALGHNLRKWAKKMQSTLDNPKKACQKAIIMEMMPKYQKICLAA